MNTANLTSEKEQSGPHAYTVRDHRRVVNDPDDPCRIIGLAACATEEEIMRAEVRLDHLQASHLTEDQLTTGEAIRKIDAARAFWRTFCRPNPDHEKLLSQIEVAHRVLLERLRPARTDHPFDPLDFFAPFGVVLVVVSAVIFFVVPFCIRMTHETESRNAVRALRYVQSAKDRFRARVLAHQLSMPAGFDERTLPDYAPSLADLAPYLRVDGLEDDDLTEQTVMLNTGDRRLFINKLGTAPACDPPPLPDEPSADTGMESHNAMRALRYVREAKEQYLDRVLAHKISMPAGFDERTLPDYAPSLADLAPYLRVDGVRDSELTEEIVMTGTGGRRLLINKLGTAPACDPPPTTKK